jgi:tetratricopeptide (TPR) repeat protein
LWLHDQRGQAYAGLRQWDKALADFTRAVQRDPKQAGNRVRRAGTLAELGRWDEAEQEFVRARDLKQKGGTSSWEALALLRLRVGDTEGYRKLCAELLDQVGTPDDVDEAGWAAWVCVLAPGAVEDPVRPLHLALKAREPQKGDAYAVTLGAALYRAKSYEAARRRLTEADKAKPEEDAAWARLFLALTYHRLGQTKEAKEALARAKEATEAAEKKRPLPWDERLELRLLSEEAEALLAKP